MLREFAMRFLVEAVAFGIAFAITLCIFGRKLRQPFFWFFLFGFTLSDAACRVIFKHYPEISTGWISYAIVAGISLVACLPVVLLMAFVLKRKKIHDHDA
jgi:hypothetical protein